MLGIGIAPWEIDTHPCVILLKLVLDPCAAVVVCAEKQVKALAPPEMPGRVQPGARHGQLKRPLLL